MEEQVQDVNPAASSPAETPTPPTEALKTEEKKHEESVPYERFNEVNSKLRELQESQDWRGYQALKTQLDNDSRFAEHFLRSVNDYYNSNQPQQPDPYAQYPQELAEPLRKTQYLEQAVQNLMYQNQVTHQNSVKSQYENRFNEKIGAMNLSDPWKDFYRKSVEMQVGMINPNALSAFDSALLDKAFELVDQQAKALQRSERGAYVAEKKQDRIPSSTSSTGTPGQTISPIKTYDERSALVAELLRVSNQ